MRKVVLLGPSRHLQDFCRFSQFSGEPLILPMSLNLLGTIHRSGNNEKYIKKGPNHNRFLWTKLHINRSEKPYIVGLPGHISMVVAVPIEVGSA